MVTIQIYIIRKRSVGFIWGRQIKIYTARLSCTKSLNLNDRVCKMLANRKQLTFWIIENFPLTASTMQKFQANTLILHETCCLTF